MADTGPLAAKLAEIRAETTVSGPRFADMDRLLAFAEEALELPGKWDAEVARLDRLAGFKEDDGERMAVSIRAQTYSECAAGLRDAISRALLGEEAGDG